VPVAAFETVSHEPNPNLGPKGRREKNVRVRVNDRTLCERQRRKELPLGFARDYAAPSFNFAGKKPTSKPRATNELPRQLPRWYHSRPGAVNCGKHGFGRVAHPPADVWLWRNGGILEYLKAFLLGVGAVFCTSILSIILEIALITLHWRSDPLRQTPDMSLGIDIVALAKSRFLNPSGLTAAIVIFTLAVVLAIRRRAP